jgi:hypothetical protein
VVPFESRIVCLLFFSHILIILSGVLPDMLRLVVDEGDGRRTPRRHSSFDPAQA